jgi:TrmH family RNA methyltransferase
LTLSKIKTYKKLNQPKYRHQLDLALAEGINSVENIIRFCPEAIREVYCDEANQQIIQRISSLTKLNKYPFYYVSRDKIDRISKNTGGVLVIFKVTKLQTKMAQRLDDMIVQPLQNKTVLVLYNISDPGNLGTIIRAAAAFGVNKIFLTSNSVDEFNPKVIRASAGTIFFMPIIRCEINPLIKSLQTSNYCILAAALNSKATKLNKADLQYQKTAFIFGSEAHGLPINILNNVNKIIYIPIQQSVESLNLAGSVYAILSLKQFLTFNS